MLHGCIAARIALISAALATESDVRVAEPSAASIGQDDGRLFKYSEFVAVPGVPECRVMISRRGNSQRTDPRWYGMH